MKKPHPVQFQLYPLNAKSIEAVKRSVLQVGVGIKRCVVERE